MIAAEQAGHFAKKWIDAWNSHKIDAIMEHYGDEIEFFSPFVAALNMNDTGKVLGKDDLRSYFLKGLEAYPDLVFHLKSVFTGVNSVVLYYTSVNNRMATEVFEFDAAGKAARVLCHYIT